MSHKYKVVIWTILPILVLIAILFVVKIRNHSEPLSKKEILKKDTWDKEELAFSLARNFKHQGGKEGNKEVLAHLQKQLQKFSPQEQEDIKTNAINQAIDDSIRQYRAMKHDEKAKLVEAMKKRAEKNYENISKMSDAQRQEVKNRLNSKDIKTAAAAMQNAMYNKLTPDERRDFADVENQWLKTLEKL